MKKKKKPRLNETLLNDYGLPILGAIVVAVMIRFFFIEAYRMPSRAMVPAVEPGDTLFVSKNSYGFRVPGATERISERIPEYGDVIVFEFPDEPGREYIKRVVGLPGDTIQVKRGLLVLNGKTLSKMDAVDDLCAMEILPNGYTYEVCTESPEAHLDEPITVRGGHVFVLGDLRANAPEITRLKTMGEVPISAIRGKASLVWLSIQPPKAGGEWFSRIRFNRMFKRIQ